MWTHEQSLAIHTRNKNLLISAAAGSGKTAVLIERIKTLIVDDKYEIDKFLIVTYTNAAAAEMRERLLKKLILEFEKKPHDVFLKNQIHSLGNAQISTLHSFCINLVRSYFYKLDVDSSFKIGDTYNLELLKQDAINQIFENQYELNDDNFIDLVEAYTSNRKDDELRQMVLKIYDFILSKPNYFEWFEGVIKSYEGDTGFWLSNYKKDIQTRLNEAKIILKRAFDICDLPSAPKEYQKAISSDIASLENLIASLQNLEEFNHYLSNYTYERLGRISKDRKDCIDVELQESVKNLRKIYKDKFIKDLSENAIYKTESEILEEFKIISIRLKSLYQLVYEFEKEYSKLKFEQNLLDFSDVEHFTIKLLKDDEVRKAIQKRFDYVFVDEYQDVNEVQECIISGVARKDNLFMVGDVKQSIYKFRLANPSIFINKMNLYTNSNMDQRIDLSKNFRSSVKILEGINQIFNRLMSVEFGEISYDKTAYLYPPSDKLDNADKLDIDIVYQTDLEGEFESLSSIEKEAYYIANKISQINKNNAYSYNDIVILLRGTKSNGKPIAKILSEHGIPCFVESTGEYFEAIEVKTVISLLKIIDNIEQDIPLLTVLRSKFFDFTIKDLVEIRKSDKKCTYYEAMYAYMMDNRDDLSKKIADFFENVQNWCRRSKYESLDSLIWEILNHNDFINFITNLPEGERRLKNIQNLLNKISELLSQGELSFYRLIKILEQMQDFTGDIGVSNVTLSSECVKIMTIHKSKGLEFPIVFVSGSNKKFNLRDSYGNILMHKDMGIALKYVDHIQRYSSKSIPQAIIKRKILEENLSEEMRILYVALTRAVDKLIVTGFVKNLDTSIRKWEMGADIFNLKMASSYMEWIMMILMSNNVDLSYFNCNKIDIASILTSTSIDDNKMNFKNILDIDYQNISLDSEEFEKFKFNNSENLPTLEHSLPIKLSVSAINKMNLENEFSPIIPTLKTVPEFLKKDMQLSATQRGTLIHNILSYIDYSRTDELSDIENQLEELKLKNIICMDGLNKTDIQNIYKFFQSKIGQRAKKSKLIKKETAFVFKDIINSNEVYVQGIIDLYFEEDDEIVLVDFKTDGVSYKDVELKAKNYYKQIELYSKALSKITGKTVKNRYLYFLELSYVYRI